MRAALVLVRSGISVARLVRTEDDDGANRARVALEIVELLLERPLCWKARRGGVRGADDVECLLRGMSMIQGWRMRPAHPVLNLRVVVERRA